MDRVSYLLQEIYGIENKNNQETKVNIPLYKSQFSYYILGTPLMIEDLIG